MATFMILLGFGVFIWFAVVSTLVLIGTVWKLFFTRDGLTAMGFLVLIIIWIMVLGYIISLGG